MIVPCNTPPHEASSRSRGHRCGLVPSTRLQVMLAHHDFSSDVTFSLVAQGADAIFGDLGQWHYIDAYHKFHQNLMVVGVRLIL
ncbi:hypothetical protein TIFTF001_017313 [Ficus carica]|uniref:Uncharacterized protein n=1 Tax=Ficus carica TaxID=3494 RepID=A0AA88DJ05_FICCA|nr:hypothetical protein TIFTF001_017313 [Ficus carica]